MKPCHFYTQKPVIDATGNVLSLNTVRPKEIAVVLVLILQHKWRYHNAIFSICDTRLEGMMS